MAGYNKEEVRKLAEYIRKQQAAGYSITTLRNYLISGGYDPKLVNAAIDYSYKPSRAPKKIPFKLLIIGATVVAVAIILGLVITKCVLVEEEPEAQVPGPITLPEIEAPEAEEARTEKPVPAVPEKEAEEREKAVPEAPEELEPEIELREEEAEQEREEPSILDIENRIPELSEGEGKKLCDSLTERKANACYKKLAITHNESEYCEEITSTGLRDNCYIVFAFAGDFTICDKIVNKYHQLNCRSLGRARTYQSEELLAKMVQNATVS